MHLNTISIPRSALIQRPDCIFEIRAHIDATNEHAALRRASAIKKPGEYWTLSREERVVTVYGKYDMSDLVENLSCDYSGGSWPGGMTLTMSAQQTKVLVGAFARDRSSLGNILLFGLEYNAEGVPSMVMQYHEGYASDFQSVEITVPEWIAKGLGLGEVGSLSAGKMRRVIKVPSQGLVSETFAPSKLAGLNLVSRVYLECDICEGKILDKKSRKILKIVPIRQEDITRDYVNYECKMPEFILLSRWNIEHIKFSLVREDGSCLRESSRDLQTVITCSVVEE